MKKKTIIKIINKINKIKKLKKQIILIDDGSTDGTKEIIKKHLINKVDKVIFHQKNKGKGSAIISSMKFVKGNLIIIQDADLEYDPSDYHKLIDAFKYKGKVYTGRTVYMGNSVVIKDFAHLGRDCKILGSSHVISDPFNPYITTGTTHDCSIEIGVNCFFGVAVIINGDVKIGHGSVIGANTFINNKNIPPFSVVVGNPSRIIKRYSMRFKQWIDIENFTEADEKNLPKEGAYLKSLIAKHPRIPMFFHATGKNFGNLP